MKPSSTLNPLQGYTSNGKLTLSPCYSNTHYPHNKQSSNTKRILETPIMTIQQPCTQESQLSQLHVITATSLHHSTLSQQCETHQPNPKQSANHQPPNQTTLTNLYHTQLQNRKSSPLEHYSRFPYQTYHISIYKLDTQPTPLKMLTNRKPQNITVATPNRATLQTTNPQPIRNHKPPVTACITIPTHPSQVSASHQIPANQLFPRPKRIHACTTHTSQVNLHEALPTCTKTSILISKSQNHPNSTQIMHNCKYQFNRFTRQLNGLSHSRNTPHNYALPQAPATTKAHISRELITNHLTTLQPTLNTQNTHNQRNPSRNSENSKRRNPLCNLLKVQHYTPLQATLNAQNACKQRNSTR
eukprot:gene3549-2500_t